MIDSDKMRTFYRSGGYQYGDIDEIVWQAVKEKDLSQFTYIDPKYFDNKEFMLEAIKNETSQSVSIQYASKRLRDDKDIVLSSVRKKGFYAIPYASKRLRDDKDVILTAIKSSARAFIYASKRLKDDYDVVSEVLKRDKSMLSHASIRIQSMYSDTIIVEGVKIKFLGDFTKEEKTKISHNCKIGLQAINKSPLDGFGYALSNGSVIIAKPEKLKSFVAPELQSLLGIYSYPNDLVVLKYLGKDLSTVIVHEFAHRFHYKYIPGGYDNPEIKELFKKATMSKKECMLVRMPSLGSPLSNLIKGDKWWWTVKRAAKEFYLKRIINDGDLYIYEDADAYERMFTREEIIKMLECPSQYGAKDEMEFFSEMCTLITMGLVTPNQKKIAYHFTQLVNSL